MGMFLIVVIGIIVVLISLIPLFIGIARTREVEEAWAREEYLDRFEEILRDE